MMALLIIGNGNDPPAHTPNLEFSDENQITKQLVSLASHVCFVYHDTVVYGVLEGKIGNSAIRSTKSDQGFR